MSLLTYQDDDLKGHDIMTLHFINNEKLLPLRGGWWAQATMEGGCSAGLFVYVRLKTNKSAVRDSLGNQRGKWHLFLLCLPGKQGDDLIDPRDLIFISERFASKLLKWCCRCLSNKGKCVTQRGWHVWASTENVPFFGEGMLGPSTWVFIPGIGNNWCEDIN